MASADAFVLASFTEGHPKVLLEAMAAGHPAWPRTVRGTAHWSPTAGPASSSTPTGPRSWPPSSTACCRTPAWRPAWPPPPREQVTGRYDLGALVAGRSSS